MCVLHEGSIIYSTYSSLFLYTYLAGKYRDVAVMISEEITIKCYLTTAFRFRHPSMYRWTKCVTSCIRADLPDRDSLAWYLERWIHVRKQCQRLQDRLLMSAYVTCEMNSGLICEKMFAQLVSCAFITRLQPCFSHSSAAISRLFVGNINSSSSQRLDGQFFYTTSGAMWFSHEGCISTCNS